MTSFSLSLSKLMTFRLFLSYSALVMTTWSTLNAFCVNGVGIMCPSIVPTSCCRLYVGSHPEAGGTSRWLRLSVSMAMLRKISMWWPIFYVHNRNLTPTRMRYGYKSYYGMYIERCVRYVSREVASNKLLITLTVLRSRFQHLLAAHPAVDMLGSCQ